ncbi:MAG: phytoene desaturase family protein [Candidatus Humimicrobiaceae bacterium]
MKKIIIIGAGIAGLTAGIYARMNGFEAEIFEMHSKPGGECTGWQRGEYHFDNCIHWLMGSKKNIPLNLLWKAIGALDESVNIVNLETFFSYDSGEKIYHIYRDLDRLQKHLIEQAPEDKKMIVRFCRDAKKYIRLEMPVEKPFDMFGRKDIFKLMLKMLPLMGVMSKYDKINVGELSQSFKNPGLKKTIASLIPSQYKASSLLATLASLHQNDSGWPQGGSLAMSKRVADKFLNLGGKINYRSKIEKVIIENKTATGIRLADGNTFFADYIVAAADAHEVIYNLLGNEYSNKEIDTLFSDNINYPIYSTAYVYLGVESDLSKYPHSLFFDLKNPIDSGGIIHKKIGVKHYCYEPSFAPKGSSILSISFNSDYSWWKEKSKNPDDYEKEKKKLLDEVTTVIEEKFPEARGKIRKTDVGTPLSFERYCKAYQGAWMSWAQTPGGKIRFITGEFPELENFYLTGQWLMPPGGLPTAVMTGNWTIQRICKKENMDFIKD